MGHYRRCLDCPKRIKCRRTRCITCGAIKNKKANNESASRSWKKNKPVRLCRDCDVVMGPNQIRCDPHRESHKKACMRARYTVTPFIEQNRPTQSRKSKKKDPSWVDGLTDVAREKTHAALENDLDSFFLALRKKEESQARPKHYKPRKIS